MSNKVNRQQARAARREAERIAAQKRRRRNRVLTVLAVVVGLALVVGLGFWIQSARDDSGEPTVAPSGATEDYGLQIGPDDAPAEVVIYEDFLCPICGLFEEATADRLEQLVAEGAVQVEYRPFVLLGRFGDYSQEAANAFWVVLDAAGPEVAKAYHDLLFAEQPPETGPYPGEEELIDLAVEAGAEREAVARGIEDGRFEQYVENATDHASKEGVNSTPTVLVNGEEITGETLGDIVAGMFGAIEAAQPAG